MLNPEASVFLPGSTQSRSGGAEMLAKRKTNTWVKNLVGIVS